MSVQLMYPMLNGMQIVPQDNVQVEPPNMYPDIQPSLFPAYISTLAVNSPFLNTSFLPQVNKGDNKFLKLFFKSKESNDHTQHFLNKFEAITNSFNALKLAPHRYNQFYTDTSFQIFYKQELSQLIAAFLSSTAELTLEKQVELFQACVQRAGDHVSLMNKDSFQEFLRYDFFLTLIVQRAAQYSQVKEVDNKITFVGAKTAEFFDTTIVLFPQSNNAMLLQNKEIEKAICHVGFCARLGIVPSHQAIDLAKNLENFYQDYVSEPLVLGDVDPYFTQQQLPQQPIILQQPIPLILPSAPPINEELIPVQPQPEVVVHEPVVVPVVVQHIPVDVPSQKMEVFIDDEHKIYSLCDRKREPISAKVDKEHIFWLATSLPWLDSLSIMDRFALLHNLQQPRISGSAEDNAYDSLAKRAQTQLVKENHGDVNAWIDSLLQQVKQTIVDQRNGMKQWGYQIIDGRSKGKSEDETKNEMRRWVDEAIKKGQIIDINAFYRMNWKQGGRILNGDSDWGKTHAADNPELFAKTFGYFVEKGYLG